MTTPHARSFGTQLRYFRERAGLTQEQLAAKAGLTAKAISALERGERSQPYLHTVHALAAALDLSKDECAALLAARGRHPAELPPISQRTAASTLLTLPAQLTTLIGREAEVDSLVQLLQR